jgi:hypothetical protein
MTEPTMQAAPVMTPTAVIIDVEGTVRRYYGPLTLDFYQEACGGYIQAVDLDEPMGSIWMNEEGKLSGLLPNEVATHVYWTAQPAHMPNDYVAGVAVLTGVPDHEGETQPVTAELVAFAEEIGARVLAR